MTEKELYEERFKTGLLFKDACFALRTASEEVNRHRNKFGREGMRSAEGKRLKVKAGAAQMDMVRARDAFLSAIRACKDHCEATGVTYVPSDSTWSPAQ